MPHADDAAPRWIAIAAVVLFTVYALNFLYYFVDDEAIPYVYAQNILHGKGLAYNGLEGRVEGYSDFLHVWISTLILGVRSLAGLPKIAVFFIGKGLSLACGVGVVVLACDIMRRLAMPRAGMAAGVATVALAGPLAVWSCSSLEAAPFALVVTVLTGALIREANRTAAAAAIILVLLRIDGFIYAALLIGAFVIVASGTRRRRMIRDIVVPVSVALVIYHAGRMLYFGDLLPAPLRAKILYKLVPHATLMVKPPERSYVAAFSEAYGWWAAIAFGAAIAHGLSRGGVARALSGAAVPLIVYVAIVGDWMFGFRFFVALLPVCALVVGSAVSSMADAAPRAAVAVSLAWIVAMGVAAGRFTDTYSGTLALPSFLHAPSRDLHLFFRPYYGFYETVRPLVPVGSITAYNQAGLLPYLLDLNNIDDFGLCSRFYASLPSTDVYFTEGGRYAALTNKPRLRVHQAYLLYRNAQFILSGTDVLRRANGTAIPSGLLGDRYQLAVTDARRDFAVYRRMAQPPERSAADPRTFVENLAHVSYLRRAAIDGAPIQPHEYARRLPFLRDGTANLQFTGSFSIDVQFARADERVYAVSIDDVRATAQASLAVTLLGTGGRIVHRVAVPLEPGRPRRVAAELPAGTTASRLVVELSTGHGVAAAARISDLRVEGQTPALQAYLARELQLPAATASGR
jgi:hypothetical protein